jgi:hypothetical protein
MQLHVKTTNDFYMGFARLTRFAHFIFVQSELLLPVGLRPKAVMNVFMSWRLFLMKIVSLHYTSQATYTSTNIIRLSEIKTVRWTVHVARMGHGKCSQHFSRKP